jgi:hypothetical protein
MGCRLSGDVCQWKASYVRPVSVLLMRMRSGQARVFVLSPCIRFAVGLYLTFEMAAWQSYSGHVQFDREVNSEVSCQQLEPTERTAVPS